ncbi:MAG: hypothetical protein ACE366_20620 [Bradymonadia bacterium]
MTTPADAAGPCDNVEDAALSTASRNLQRGQAPQWRRVTAQLEVRIEALPPSSPHLACAHYLAAEGHFYLSSAGRRPDRIAAARALEHLWQSIRLDPAIARSRQSRVRLKTAWSRLKGVDGWSVRKALVPVALPQRGPDGRLTLGPSDPERGCAGPCPEGLALTLPLPSKDEAVTAIPMAPGRYQATIVTACGRTTGLITLPLGAGPDPWPAAPKCPVVEVTPPKCEGATLAVDATPKQAQIEGDGSGPWGPREVKVTMHGHVSREMVVDVPEPTDCDAPHRVSITLARRVTVVAYDGDGEALTPGSLVIDDTPSTVLDLALEPGSHTWRAAHPWAGKAEGVIDVPVCGTTECRPVTLGVAFPESRSVVPVVSYVSGGLLFVTGLGFGAVALQDQRRIDNYSSQVDEDISIDQLINSRDDRINAANTLTGIGGALILTGLIWQLLEAE